MDICETIEKILVIGGSGLLGGKLLKLLPDDSKKFGTYNTRPVKIDTKNCRSYHLDITNKKDTEHLIVKISPDIIVHTAALTNVDYCETNKSAAWDVNVEGTRNIAESSRETNSKLVYVSTDYVFDGKRGMYKEDDQTNPVDHYGKTKLEGEKVVQELCENYIIARTSVLYGWHSKPNFVTWVIKELKQEHKINIVQDQFTSPTLADNLAELILKLIEKKESGIFHTAGSERICRFEFTKRIAEVFNLNKNLINPISSDKLNWIAKRPMDSSLDVTKVSGIKRPLNINESLKLMEHVNY